jgi:D-beta-D-heptose 7-phosphate kinase/D-beta-D-heptose 1-phosphate adenosyltransferase
MTAESLEVDMPSEANWFDLPSQFKRRRVLCIGDVMLDRFIFGSASRISPESPVPVLLMQRSETMLGGAGNVARNVTSLGATCTLVGVVGDDAVGREINAILVAHEAISAVLLVDPSRPSTEKARYIALGQQLLRVDREESKPIANDLRDQIAAAVGGWLPGHDVVLLSDYAKGLLTDDVARSVIQAARAAGVPVVVDPKSARLSRYDGSTVVTPNVRELAAATGMVVEDDESAMTAGLTALAACNVDAFVITRAEQGITIVSRRGEHHHVRATAHEVFDVSGAGDTVLACLGLGIGAGLPLNQCAEIANAAAGIVVGKVGTAVVTTKELVTELNRLQTPQSTRASTATRLDAAVHQVDRWRRHGHKIGFTNGCFDLLHPGHIHLLNFSRRHCDRLVVGLNSDASVRQLKGPARPVQDERSRAEVLAALAAVDVVVLFEEDTPELLIKTLNPDVLVKGADYGVDQVIGGDHVIARGGQVLLCDLLPDHSTTRTVNRIKE